MHLNCIEYSSSFANAFTFLSMMRVLFFFSNENSGTEMNILKRKCFCFTRGCWHRPTSMDISSICYYIYNERRKGKKCIGIENLSEYSLLFPFKDEIKYIKNQLHFFTRRNNATIWVFEMWVELNFCTLWTGSNQP